MDSFEWILDFEIESNALDSLLLCPSTASSSSSLASSSKACSSFPLAPPASGLTNQDEDGDDIRAKEHPLISSLSTLLNTEELVNHSFEGTSILEKAVLLAITNTEDEEEEEEEITRIQSIQVPFKSNADSVLSISSQVDRNPRSLEKSKEDPHGIWSITDFEDLLLLDFSCLEDEANPINSGLITASPLPNIQESENCNSSIESEPMSALFAFNASCSSPSVFSRSVCFAGKPIFRSD
jgi:hypothetical protein